MNNILLDKSRERIRFKILHAKRNEDIRIKVLLLYALTEIQHDTTNKNTFISDIIKTRTGGLEGQGITEEELQQCIRSINNGIIDPAWSKYIYTTSEPVQKLNKKNTPTQKSIIKKTPFIKTPTDRPTDRPTEVPIKDPVRVQTTVLTTKSQIEHSSIPDVHLYTLEVGWSESSLSHKIENEIVAKMKEYLSLFPKVKEKISNVWSNGPRNEYVVRYEYIGNDEMFEVLKKSSEYIIKLLSNNAPEIRVFGKKLK